MYNLKIHRKKTKDVIEVSQYYICLIEIADDLSIFKILLSLLNWIFITDRLCTRDANLNISSLFVHVHIVFAYMQIVWIFSYLKKKKVYTWAMDACQTGYVHTLRFTFSIAKERRMI